MANSPQYCILSAPLEQVGVGSVFNDTSLVYNEDSVGPCSGGEAVRDDDRGAVSSGASGGVEDGAFGGGVEGGRGFVEKQHRGLEHFGAGERDDLALPGACLLYTSPSPRD